jgi:uncharacterized protein YbaP (TraB family)
MLRRAALLLVVLLPLAAAAQGQRWGPLFEVTSSEGKAYLAASTHSNGHRELALGPATQRALADSDLVVLERLPSGHQSPIQKSRSEAVAKMMFRPGSTSLLDDIPPAVAARLQAVLKTHDVPDRGWELVLKTRTPLVPEVMTVILAKYGDYSVELQYPGADDLYLRFARDNNIELDEVEGATVVMANRLSVTLPEANAAIVKMLEDVEAPRSKEKRGAKLIESLETIYGGDLERLYASQRREECGTPALQAYCDRVVDGRNAAMAESIEALVKKGRRPFVAVGALHLAGPASIQKALEKRGYSVRRLD